MSASAFHIRVNDEIFSVICRVSSNDISYSYLHSHSHPSQKLKYQNNKCGISICHPASMEIKMYSLLVLMR